MTKVDALVALAAGLSYADLGELRARLASLAHRANHQPTVVADLPCMDLADTITRPDPDFDYLYRPVTSG
jgi:hypothetical protein